MCCTAQHPQKQPCSHTSRSYAGRARRRMKRWATICMAVHMPRLQHLQGRLCTHAARACLIVVYPANTIAQLFCALAWSTTFYTSNVLSLSLSHVVITQAKQHPSTGTDSAVETESQRYSAA